MTFKTFEHTQKKIFLVWIFKICMIQRDNHLDQVYFKIDETDYLHAQLSIFATFYLLSCKFMYV